MTPTNPFKGPAHLFEAIENPVLPACFVMHPCVIGFLSSVLCLVDQGKVYGVPYILDNNQPHETTWQEIIAASQNIKVGHKTLQQLIDGANATTYTVNVNDWVEPKTCWTFDEIRDMLKPDRNLLSSATTEELVDVLKTRGYRVVLESPASK